MYPDDLRERKDIVRRKLGGQAVDSRERHTKSMSRKTTIGIAALAVLGCATGVFYWLRARGEQHPPEVVSAEPRGFREAPPPEKSAAAPPVKSTSPTDSKKAAPPVDTGL